MTPSPDRQIPNIGPSGRRRRLRLGVAFLAAALLGLLALELSTGGPWSRLILFPLFFTGFIAVLEARAGTCVIHAARGTCGTEQREAFARDNQAADINRRRSRRLMVQTLLLAAIATLVAMLV